jgi:hypothetical protein
VIFVVATLSFSISRDVSGVLVFKLEGVQQTSPKSN